MNNRSHEQSVDTVYVSGFPINKTEDDIKDFFGSIGIIKMDKKTRKPKIYIYKDKATGESKGECTVTYDDPEAAKAAVNWFNEKDFHGSVISVSLATHRSGGDYGKARGGAVRGGRGGFKGGFGRGGGGGGGGGGYNDDERGGGGGGRGRGEGRAGDWRCPDCNNNNFAWRTDCNRCHTAKPEGGSGGGGGYGGGGRDGGYGGGGRDGGYGGGGRDGGYGGGGRGGGGYGGGGRGGGGYGGGGGRDGGGYGGGGGGRDGGGYGGGGGGRDGGYGGGRDGGYGGGDRDGGYGGGGGGYGGGDGGRGGGAMRSRNNYDDRGRSRPY